MRERADATRIRALLRELGRHGTTPARVYVTGGATAVLEGWRSSTIAIDLSLEPEDDALMRMLPKLKERLDLNIELVAPGDFIPPLPGWRDRSPFLWRTGAVGVHHLDPYSQALSKVERGFEHDLADVDAMLDAGLVEAPRALDLFRQIEPDLYRYPAIDAAAFTAKVRRAFSSS